MIKLKDFYDGACEIHGCTEESTKIWAGSESGIIDVCIKHYEELTGVNG